MAKNSAKAETKNAFSSVSFKIQKGGGGDFLIHTCKGWCYRSFSRDVTYLPVAILVDHFSRGSLKMAPGPQENVVKSSENIEEKAPIPLSQYANKLEPKVKKRNVEKISVIGIDPVLIEGNEPDCLPPVESTDLLFYLVLETSYYTKQQFKAFRSLQAYNQMVSGFIASVQAT